MIDPNSDLLGYRIRDQDGRLLVVTGTAPWSNGYVYLEARPLDCLDDADYRASRTCRVADQVRLAKTNG